MFEYSEGDDSNAHLSFLRQSQCLIPTFSASEFPIEPRQLDRQIDACLGHIPFLTESYLWNQYLGGYILNSYTRDFLTATKVEDHCFTFHIFPEVQLGFFVHTRLFKQENILSSEKTNLYLSHRNKKMFLFPSIQKSSFLSSCYFKPSVLFLHTICHAVQFNTFINLSHQNGNSLKVRTIMSVASL